MIGKALEIHGRYETIASWTKYFNSFLNMIAQLGWRVELLQIVSCDCFELSIDATDDVCAFISCRSAYRLSEDRPSGHVLLFRTFNIAL